MSLPVFTAGELFDRVENFGGCFRDPKGDLWGTCVLHNVWARYPAVRLAERTGVSVATLRQPNTLRGNIDECDTTRLEGWAQDTADPDAPVGLDVTINGKLVARMQADLLREDLLAAGIGDGRHAFDLTLPNQLSRTADHIVVVQRSGDGAFLGVILVRAARS